MIDASTTRFIPWAASARATIVLTVAIALARLAYLLLACPYNLIEDEAHYWEWSRHLDWSYYSKGPGVAWTIWASTSVFGVTEFAVRVTSPLFAAVTMFAISRLARDIAGDWRAGFLAAVLLACAPAFEMSGLLFVIDGPYCACWSLAALAGFHAMFRSSGKAWVLLGLALATGFIYKYTIVLLVPGLLAATLMCRHELKVHRHWKLLAAACTLCGLLGLLPIAIWNSQHDWVTVRHLLGHLGVKGGDMPVTQGAGSGYHYDPKWTLDFLGAQFGFLAASGVPMVAGMIAWWRSRRAGGMTEQAYLHLAAAPILIFYTLVSFVTEPEGNWAMGGYLTLFVTAALWLLPRLDQAALQPMAPSAARGIWRAVVIIGVTMGAIMLRLDWVESGLAQMGVSEKLRRAIPMSRLSGAPEMAAHVDRLMTQLRQETGKEPFVLAQHYGRASQLAFYLPGHPRGVVLCASARTGGRTSQYDLWDDTSLARPDLIGRPAVIAGGDSNIAQWQDAFEKVTLVGTLDGDRKRGRPACLGVGYWGWR